MPQSVEGGWKIRQTVLRGICEHAQRSQDGEAPAFCFATPVPFVNEQGVCGSFLGQRDGGTFASSEALIHSNEFTAVGPCTRIQAGGLAIQCWTMSGVCSWLSSVMTIGGTQYAAVKRLQDVGVLDEDQIP